MVDRRAALRWVCFHEFCVEAPVKVKRPTPPPGLLGRSSVAQCTGDGCACVSSAPAIVQDEVAA